MKNLRNDNHQKENFKNIVKVAGPDCGCDSTSCCDTTEMEKGVCCEPATKDTKITQTSVTIDGQKIDVYPGDKNIVDVASRAKIGIPAPCYLARRKHGCCNACVIDIDGEQKFACATEPKDGMNITVNREDLKAIRKERLLKYKEAMKSGTSIPCSCSDDEGCDCDADSECSC